MNLCEGCLTKAHIEKARIEGEKLRCKYSFMKESCPCINCLVKPVCKSKDKCEAFFNT